MGQSLYNESPIAQKLYDQANDVLGWSLTEASFEGPESLLTETRVCQPALYVMGYSVYSILKASGKLDGLKATLGLSLGELTALAAAEAVDFTTGLQIVAERGRLMQQACDATDGAMASIIGGDTEKVEALCRAHDIDIGNFNCPGQIVISGETANVSDAVAAAKASGDFKMVVPLKVAGAYHSRLMDSARIQFEQFLEGVVIKAPAFTVFTNTTGGTVSSPEAIKEALVKQVVSSVRWDDCVRGAAALGIQQFYECGPGAVLNGLARRIDRSLTVTSIAEFSDLSA